MALTPAEPRERERADVRPRPGRDELRPGRNQQQRRQARHALDREVEQLLCGRVEPVRVLVGEQHRPFRRDPFEPVEERRERQLLLALRGQIERRVATFRRRAEQRRDQRHRLIQPVGAARQQCFVLLELFFGAIAGCETCRALQLLDQRMQRTGVWCGEHW
jgi:hypothetical protein